MSALVLFLVLSCSVPESNASVEEKVPTEVAALKYGLEIEKYDIVQGVVKKGDSFGSIMEDFGVGANQVQRILKASDEVFDVRKVKLGSKYEILRIKDSVGAAAFFVYELDNLSFAVVSLRDSLYARIHKKEIETV